MKKAWIFGLSLALAAVLFTGCGCTNQAMETTTAPTTTPTSAPTTAATTAPTTTPTTRSTEPENQPTSTADNGNGPLDETQNTNPASRGRRSVTNMK